MSDRLDLDGVCKQIVVSYITTMSLVHDLAFLTGIDGGDILDALGNAVKDHPCAAVPAFSAGVRAVIAKPVGILGDQEIAALWEGEPTCK